MSGEGIFGLRPNFMKNDSVRLWYTLGNAQFVLCHSINFAVRDEFTDDRGRWSNSEDATG